MKEIAREREEATVLSYSGVACGLFGIKSWKRSNPSPPWI